MAVLLTLLHVFTCKHTRLTPVKREVRCPTGTVNLFFPLRWILQLCKHTCLQSTDQFLLQDIHELCALFLCRTAVASLLVPSHSTPCCVYLSLCLHFSTQSPTAADRVSPYLVIYQRATHSVHWDTSQATEDAFHQLYF